MLLLLDVLLHDAQGAPPVVATKVAGIKHLPIALVCLAHRIKYTAPRDPFQEQMFLSFAPSPFPRIRNAPFIPMDESQGLSGAVMDDQLFDIDNVGDEQDVNEEKSENSDIPRSFRQRNDLFVHMSHCSTPRLL